MLGNIYLYVCQIRAVNGLAMEGGGVETPPQRNIRTNVLDGNSIDIKLLRGGFDSINTFGKL